MEGTPDNGGGSGGFTPTGEIPPLPIVLYNADTNNWECVSCVTTFQTESQLDAHLQLHNELGRSIITTTPTTPEKFSFDNPASDLLQSTSFDAPDFDDFITEFEKITGGSGSSGQDGFSSEIPYPLIIEDHFISGSATGIPTTTTTAATSSFSTVINVPSVINPLLHHPPPIYQPPPPPIPISQPLPPPPPPIVQIQAGPSKASPGPIPPNPVPRPRKRYQCSQCSKDFSRPSYLRNHQETHHHPPTPVVTRLDTSKMCPICSKGFSTQWHLTQHMKTHTSEMSYCCAHCGKEFSDRENMQKHMEVHKPEVTKPPPPPKIMNQSRDADIAVVNVVASSALSSKYKSEKIFLPPPPPVVDLEEETDVILETDLEPEVDDDEDSEGFECGMCDKIFETIKQLRIHERMMHEDKLMEVDKREIPNPQVKFNSIANTLLKNESLLRSMSMSRRNKRKRWSLSTMEKYEYCASLICDIKKKLGKALKILEPGSFDRRLRRKIKKKRRDKDNEWLSCKVTSSGIKIFNQRRKFEPVSVTAQICTTNIYACIVCGLKVNSVTILKRHVLAEHANIIGGPSASEAAPEVRKRPRSPPPAPQKQFKSHFVGPLSKSPQKQMGPAQKHIAPPPPVSTGTSSKIIGPHPRTIGPLSKTTGPPSKTGSPLSKRAGPLSKTMMMMASKQKSLPPKTMGTAPKHMAQIPKPHFLSTLLKPIRPPPQLIGLPPNSKPMGPSPKPVGPLPKPFGLPPKTMGPPPRPIVHPQKSKGTDDDDLIVVYQTVNLPKSPTKSPLKPGTGKRTTNFAANQAKKKAERIAAQAILEKAQLAEMDKSRLEQIWKESRNMDKSIINPSRVNEFEQDGIFGRVNIRDFQGIKSILGPSRAIVKLTTEMKSRPELPTPSQRKSEQSLLNDRITIQSASEQARKDRRKSLLLNQAPPVKSSICTRSKSLIKMEKELRVVLWRIDDDAFDFTELLFLNKMC